MSTSTPKSQRLSQRVSQSAAAVVLAATMGPWMRRSQSGGQGGPEEIVTDFTLWEMALTVTARWQAALNLAFVVLAVVVIIQVVARSAVAHTIVGALGGLTALLIAVNTASGSYYAGPSSWFTMVIFLVSTIVALVAAIHGAVTKRSQPTTT